MATATTMDDSPIQQQEGLTDEEIARENEFLKGLPRVNWGAFLMPPVWGAANGLVIAVLFYPAWIFVDNSIYTAVHNPSVLNITVAALMTVIILAVSLVFSIVTQPFAAHRAENRGVSREQYLKRQRIWAIVCAIVAVGILVLATYYNLEIRPFVATE